MNRLITRYRTACMAVVVSAVVALVAIAPHLSVSHAAPGALWSERTVSAPATTVPAPNWVELTKALKPAVVNISTKRVQEGAQMQSPFGNDDPFQQFFKQFGGQPQRRTVRSMGSGFVINSAGYIVTNNHVVENATEILVKVDDGRELPGKVVGRDPRTDLAASAHHRSSSPIASAVRHGAQAWRDSPR